MKLIRLGKTLLRNNSWFVGVFQALLVFVSLTLSWFIMFNFTLPWRGTLLAAGVILVVVRMIAIARFGLLHGWWRYTGLSDAFEVVMSVYSGSALFYLAIRFVLRVPFPRQIFVLEPVLTAAMLIGVRFLSRVLAESVRQDLTASKKVLLIGAGAGAQTVVRELARPGSEYAPIGYVDDDRSKAGLKIEGLPVFGTVDQLPKIVSTYPIDEVLIAVPSASSKQMQRFVELCEQTRVKFRTVPALRDVFAQTANLSDFREVNVEDLLGRDPVTIDLESLRGALRHRSVMVTGAAGSIGSELCRQILEHEPRLLVCIDQNETGIFYLARELSRSAAGSAVRPHVADIGDRKRMEHIFEEDEPEIIFHAAAYKHVPLMEENVAAAVQNNVFGLMNFLEMAGEHECREFVFVSSDKAVNPSSVMGATKRIGELIIARRPLNGMRCLSVRFGNVLGSNGSIVPVLRQQLRNNEPLTVTHPEIKRFFMTMREAVSLVLQASVIGEKGDTFVLDMGQPMLVLDLVRTLIKLSGRNEDQVDIRFTGLRQGEKLVEELFYQSEQVEDTLFPKIKRARGPAREWDPLLRELEELEAALFLNRPEVLRAKIKEILPEYSYLSENEPKATLESEPSSTDIRANVA
jgi:FlaA1/EpsC-like NDP-sugar epimerase